MLHMVRARWLWDERETTRTPAASREAEDGRVGACEIDSAPLPLCPVGPGQGGSCRWSWRRISCSFLTCKLSVQRSPIARPKQSTVDILAPPVVIDPIAITD